MAQGLIVTEIYKSIQGEALYAGHPCTFVRLTGCGLRCRWCDTAYAFEGGKQMSISEIEVEVKKEKAHFVEITGGEPLAQKNTPALIRRLIGEGFRVMIETGGSISIAELPTETHIIMDLKCPGSGMAENNLYSNIELLKPTDEVKFVIADRADFDWAKEISLEYDLFSKCSVLVSPAFGILHPKSLTNWLLEDGFPIKLNLQWHKYIWSPKEKGV